MATNSMTPDLAALIARLHTYAQDTEGYLKQGFLDAAEALISFSANKERMRDAIWQALDDMDTDGYCVCEQTKDMLRVAHSGETTPEARAASAEDIYDAELGKITAQDREYAAELIDDMEQQLTDRDNQIESTAQWLRKVRYEAVIEDRKGRAASPPTPEARVKSAGDQYTAMLRALDPPTAVTVNEAELEAAAEQIHHELGITITAARIVARRAFLAAARVRASSIQQPEPAS